MPAIENRFLITRGEAVGEDAAVGLVGKDAFLLRTGLAAFPAPDIIHYSKYSSHLVTRSKRSKRRRLCLST